jgi:DNA invertase Pin-like site-specific DNA recombinase
MNAVVYLRVSSQEQADSRLGLESQEAICRDFCRRSGMTVVEIITDPGVRGSIPLYDREGGRRLLELTRDRSLVVVALCQDRLFRSLIDCMATLERWEDSGTVVKMVDAGEVNLEDPDGWLKAAINALFAEYERRKASQRTRRALAAAKANGRRIGGVPYGMRPTATFSAEGKKVDAGVWAMVPEEQASIDRVVELRKARHSAAEVARRLNAEGRVTKNGKAWTHTHVLRVERRINGSA